MEDKNFVQFIENNVGEIIENIMNTFELDMYESKEVLLRCVNIIVKDPFYNSSMDYEMINGIFNKVKLNNLKDFLLKLDMSTTELKKMIINTPQILLYSTRINLIYPIFKNDEFKGYALINNDKFKSYSISNINQNDFSSEGYYEFYNYDYIVNQMLEQLNREDIKEELKIENNADLKTKFNSLVREYSMKNYHFKR